MRISACRKAQHNVAYAALLVLVFASFTQSKPASRKNCSLHYIGTVLLARHGEKQKTPRDDPPLLPAGEERARKLAHVCAKAGVDTIYASGYQRTQLTAKPLASTLGLSVNIKLNRKLLVADINKNRAGKVVLVVSHSDKLPLIINLLGGDSPGHLNDYDRLYVLTRMNCSCGDEAHNKVITLNLQYGKPSP